MLFVVTGPSGCGKSTMIHHVMRDLRRVRFSVSHTTRPRRPSESEGKDYHFVSRAVFERMIARKQFAEWAVVHGQLYGTSKREIAAKSRSGDLILDIDVQGARQMMASGVPLVPVFVLPPRYQDLVRRLRGRGEDKSESDRAAAPECPGRGPAGHEVRLHHHQRPAGPGRPRARIRHPGQPLPPGGPAGGRPRSAGEL